MSVLLRAVGIAFVSLIAVFVLKSVGSGLQNVIKVGACILLFSLVMLKVADGIDAIRDVYFSIQTENAFLGEAISVMIKALVIALIGRFGADICKECGEGGLSQGIEAVSGAVIFSLSLPILGKILEFASEVLQKGE